MNVRKILKKIGGSIGIYFNKEEQLTNDLKAGDVIDIEVKKVKIEKEG